MLSIQVNVVDFIKEEKRDSKSGGKIVRVRGGDPGGNWHRKPDSASPVNNTGDDLLAGLILCGAVLLGFFLFGKCSIQDIPTIRVLLHNGEWTTSDNRRLWVFRHLERLGKCNEIPVIETYYIPDTKLTSHNDGQSVRVRGNPGGVWHKRPRKASPVFQSQRRIQSQNWLTKASSGYGNNVNRSYLNTVRSHTSYIDEPQIGHDYGRSQTGYGYDRSPGGYNQGFASGNAYYSSIRRSTPEENFTIHGRSSYRVSDGHASGTRRSEYRPTVQSVRSNDSWCTIL